LANSFNAHSQPPLNPQRYERAARAADVASPATGGKGAPAAAETPRPAVALSDKENAGARRP
jgi:hypothetical protein